MKAEQVGLAVTFSTWLREVLASNFNHDSSYTDKGFPWFTSVSPGLCCDNTSVKPRPLRSESFAFILYRTIQRCIVGDSESD
jgi:hypothetical protein